VNPTDFKKQCARALPSCPPPTNWHNSKEKTFEYQLPIGIVWSAIWQFKNNQNTILLVPFFYILHTGRVALDTFHFISPHHPRPLGLLRVGLKHKPFVFCPHYWGAWYPDLRALQIPTGPTSVGRFLTFIKNLRFRFF
jgi:hypothetical protein